MGSEMCIRDRKAQDTAALERTGSAEKITESAGYEMGLTDGVLTWGQEIKHAAIRPQKHVSATEVETELTEVERIGGDRRQGQLDAMT